MKQETKRVSHESRGLKSKEKCWLKGLTHATNQSITSSYPSFTLNHTMYTLQVGHRYKEHVEFMISRFIVIDNRKK